MSLCRQTVYCSCLSFFDLCLTLYDLIRCPASEGEGEGTQIILRMAMNSLAGACRRPLDSWVFTCPVRRAGEL